MAKGAETKWGRPQMSRSINRIPHAIVIPNKNTGKGYISGLPDGFAFVRGDDGVCRTICIENKGDMGSVFLGDVTNHDLTEGWHWHQREWWRKVALGLGLPYYISLWVYGQRKVPSRINMKLAHMYLMRPYRWLFIERIARTFDSKTVALNAELSTKKMRSVTIDRLAANTELLWSDNVWTIPPAHSFWRDAQRGHDDRTRQ